MANDYRAFQAQLAQDISTASVAARSTSGRKTQKFRLTNSALRNLVPVGATIEVQPTVFSKLKPGDVVYVRINRDLELRRFIKLKMVGTDSYLSVISDQSKEPQTLPKSSLVGKVVEVTHNGKSWDPAKEGAFKHFMNLLTEYGTHTPFSGLLKLGKKG